MDDRRDERDERSLAPLDGAKVDRHIVIRDCVITQSGDPMKLVSDHILDAFTYMMGSNRDYMARNGVIEGEVLSSRFVDDCRSCNGTKVVPIPRGAETCRECLWN